VVLDCAVAMTRNPVLVLDALFDQLQDDAGAVLKRAEGFLQKPSWRSATCLRDSETAAAAAPDMAIDGN